ncbi:MAG: hypothetical protein JNL01_08970 [Bdellovibrionales bacterium]|nr:hypothetical protein [Bdellovibrionales bacterium]
MLGTLWVVLGIGILAWSNAPATAPRSYADCEALFATRPATIQDAADCYEEVATAAALAGDSALRLKSLQMRAEASAWVAIRESDKAKRSGSISAGRKTADLMIAEFPKDSAGYYWRAVYVSRDAYEKDVGALIPRETLRAVPGIKKDLVQAMNLGPEVHGFGPNRVYGLIYAQMPALVGGDKKIGEDHLKKAYAGAPRFSVNALELGRFYKDEKRYADAKVVLADLVSLTATQFDSTRIPETAEDQAEALKIWNAIP